MHRVTPPRYLCIQCSCRERKVLHMHCRSGAFSLSSQRSKRKSRVKIVWNAFCVMFLLKCDTQQFHFASHVRNVSRSKKNMPPTAYSGVNVRTVCTYTHKRNRICQFHCQCHVCIQFNLFDFFQFASPSCYTAYGRCSHSSLRRWMPNGSTHAHCSVLGQTDETGEI